MTVNEFIESCPEGIRLGQWFVICYWKGEATGQSRELFQFDEMKEKLRQNAARREKMKDFKW